MKALTDRRVIVTGGASGIGAACVRRFVKEGARVAIADINEAEGIQLANNLGGSAFFVRCDHVSAKDNQAVVNAVCERWGGLDILYNNAGIGLTGSFAKLPETELSRIIEINIKGPMLMTQAALSELRKSVADHPNLNPVILFTASNLGLIGLPNISAYSVSKHAIIGLMRNLAMELGPEGIRVNCICPGMVETMLLKQTTSAWGNIEQVIESAAARYPLRRIVKDEEVANAALFLVSAEASAVHGVSLLVDCGSVCR